MCPNPQFPADLVTFTEEIGNGKLHFLCSEKPPSHGFDRVLNKEDSFTLPTPSTA